MALRCRSALRRAEGRVVDQNIKLGALNAGGGSARAAEATTRVAKASANMRMFASSMRGESGENHQLPNVIVILSLLLLKSQVAYRW